MFVSGARNFHSRRTWYDKPAPKTSTRKWSRFVAQVSGASIMGIMCYAYYLPLEVIQCHQHKTSVSTVRRSTTENTKNNTHVSSHLHICHLLKLCHQYTFTSKSTTEIMYPLSSTLDAIF